MFMGLDRFSTENRPSRQFWGLNPSFKMYLEPSRSDWGYKVGDVIPNSIINNLENGVDWEDIGWFDSIWGFVDVETGKKVGSMAMAMEDHRGFQGANVYAGYNPWGWGSVTELRGKGFSEFSILAPEEMERIASEQLVGLKIVDEAGEEFNRLENYLPFNESVNKFNTLVPLIEDEEAGIDEYKRALVENGIGTIDPDVSEFNYQINRFTQKEMDDLIASLNRSLTPDQINYLGIGDMQPGDMQLPLMFNNIINSIPEADFALLKNELSGNSRFSLPVEAWQRTFETWIQNDARSSWFDREYLERLAEDNNFLQKLYIDPSAVHENGVRFVNYDPDSYYKWSFELNDFDEASFLDMVFDTIAGKEVYPEYESLRAALFKEVQTPTRWNPVDLRGQRPEDPTQARKPGFSNLDNLQPTFRNDRFGLTNRNRLYDSKRTKTNRPGIRYRNYDQGRGVYRRYVANPLKKLPSRTAAWIQADLLRNNGQYVRSVKMSDGTYLNYTSPKSQKPTYRPYSPRFRYAKE